MFGISFYIISDTKKSDIFLIVFYINFIPSSRRNYADVTGCAQLVHHRSIRTAKTIS